MGLLDGLKGLFGGGSGGGAPSSAAGFFFYVRGPSGHPIRVGVNRAHDLAADYGDGEAASGYVLTKHVVCPRCYKTIRAQIRFDARYREQGREIQGGSYIDAAEYDAETAGQGG
jgi:hypothetical protein